MKGKIIAAILAIALLALIIASFLHTGQIYSGDIGQYQADSSKLEAKKGSYNAYIKDSNNINIDMQNKNSKHEVEASFNASLSDTNNFDLFSVDGLNGVITNDEVDNNSTNSEGIVVYDVDVPAAGFYNILINYRNVKKFTINSHTYTSKSGAVERTLLINDTVPFIEAQTVKFTRIWKDDFPIENGQEQLYKFKNNEFGQIRPTQVEDVFTSGNLKGIGSQDVLTRVNDFELKTIEPYKFFFNKGRSTLTLRAIREPMLISSIRLVLPEELKSYDEVFNDWKQQNIPFFKKGDYQRYTDQGEHITVKDSDQIFQQAELMYRKSSPVLVPLVDQDDYNTLPYNNGSFKKLNIVGVYSWRLPGYWISYKIDAPMDGLYMLTLRGKQNIKQGSFVTRQVKINGEVQYKEATRIPISFSPSLNNFTVGTYEKPYYFRLKKGENIIEMKSSLGNVGELLSQVTDVADNLNNLYLEVLSKVGGRSRDDSDLNLYKTVPNMEKVLTDSKKTLEYVVEEYKKINNGNSGQVSVLNTMVYQLSRLIDGLHKDLIKYELESFSSNISAIGTWLNTEKEQPFTMDAFYFHSKDAKIPIAKANFFQSMWLQLSRFYYSFSPEVASNSTKSLRVWITTGRDNLQILRRVIDDKLNQDPTFKNIGINLELVPVDALLRATISGKGPDVAISVPEGTPIDFAFRDAAVDVSKLPGYDQIANQFYPSAITPFEYNNGVYALPEQQTFPVLFYRKDIFEQYKPNKLNVPTNWQEVKDLIQKLNSQSKEFYIESGIAAPVVGQNLTVSNTINSGLFGTLLYQYGGEYYNKQGTKSALNSEEALAAFKDFTNYFTQYKVPVDANFVTRFRSGRMAAGIIDYQTYNTIVVFAPEIAGKWAIAPVPEYIKRDSNGNIIRQSNVVASKINASTILLKGSKHKKEAWEFMKWWLKKDTQLTYARELVTILGAAARYTTANKEALEELSWPTTDLRVISLMMSRTKGVPQVPGGYMTSRQFSNGFFNVVNNNIQAIPEMTERVNIINKELNKKRKEFGLDGSDR